MVVKAQRSGRPITTDCDFRKACFKETETKTECSDRGCCNYVNYTKNQICKHILVDPINNYEPVNV